MSDLRSKLIRLAYNNPGQVQDAILPLLTKEAATRYNVDGEMLTKAKMLAKAVSKEIVFMSGKPKPTYHAIMSGGRDDEASVFTISKRDFEKSKLKDITSKKTLGKAQDLEIKDLLKGTQFNVQVDYNEWVKAKKRTKEDMIKWLKDH